MSDDARADERADERAARWRLVESIFGAALEQEPAARDALLHAACGDDATLRAEVASLLAAHERTGAVDRLAADVAPLAAGLRPPPEAGAAAGASLEGRTVGPYQVGPRVGGGGMGVVHEAHDARLGRTVAIKFLQPHLGADPRAADRFRNEARAAGALEHPGICTVHEIGETPDGLLYLVMPRYEGETLQQRIARGPLPVEHAVAIALQVLRGLAKAHARGIVHRDIKPSNVFVTDDGVVKLLDFGIAKLVDVTLTGTAGLPGTLAYMSPEQATGEPVDQRTDLWALGVVLYEMLTGERPHLSALAVAAGHARGADPAAALVARRPDVPPALARAVATALAPAPADRHASAPAFEQALAALGMPADLSSGGLPAGRVHAGRARRTRRRLVLAAAAALALLAATGAGLRLRAARVADAAAASAAVPTTIAVLPFVDRSAGRAHEYLGDGLTEELIATLAQVEGLRVASRTSAFAFKDREVDVRTVGAQLGVATVLEGSVRRAGDRLRVTAQLVSVADGYQLWSESYDREAGDGFAIQQEIARAIVQRLRGRLVAGTRAPALASAASAPNAAGYDLYLKGRSALYLKGRYAWYRRTEEGLRDAVRYFEQAVTEAPGYPRAHAGLADAYAVLGFYDYLPPAEAFPKAAAAARRALALDPTFAAPHATLGYVALYHDWDFAGAEAEFRRAIALDPNYSTAEQWYANLLAAAGRLPEAERAMRRAQEIDPLSLIASAALGWVHYHARDHAAALAQLGQTLELNPDYGLAHLWRGWVLQEVDSLDAAVAAHRRALALSDSSALYVASLARALAVAGDRAEAESLLDRLQGRATAGTYVASYEIAKVHLALGRRDAALDWLERAADERAHSMVLLRVDPQLDALRGEARFARLERRVFGA